MVGTWNYVGRIVRDNGRILARAALSAMGTRVRVAPFRDDVLTRMGVWLEGEQKELAAVRESLDAALSKDKIRFSALPWTGAREK